jgi:hypothetical protein
MAHQGASASGLPAAPLTHQQPPLHDRAETPPASSPDYEPDGIIIIIRVDSSGGIYIQTEPVDADDDEPGNGAC